MHDEEEEVTTGNEEPRTVVHEGEPSFVSNIAVSSAGSSANAQATNPAATTFAVAQESEEHTTLEPMLRTYDPATKVALPIFSQVKPDTGIRRTTSKMSTTLR